MKLFYILIVCFSVWGCSDNNRQSVRTPLKENLITTIETANQVEDLLHSSDANYRHYKIHDTVFYHNEYSKRLADSLNQKPWYKADFDNNGYLDLLVIIPNGRSNEVICVLDSGNNNFKVKRVYWTYFSPNVFASTATVSDTDVIVFRTVSKEHHHSLTVDTLIYKYGGFIEYNRQPKEHSIEKIVYSTSTCEGTCPIFSLEINPNEESVYDAVLFNNDTGKFCCKISADKYNELLEILYYADFPNLNDEYILPVTDIPGCFLKITYNNGNVKAIKDIGQQGTFGLILLYNKLFDLRSSQKWEKIE